MVRTIVAMRISFVGLVTCSPSSTGASGGGVEASMTSGWTGVRSAAPSGLGLVTRHSVGCGADQETVPGYGPGRIDPRLFGGADGRAAGPPGASAGSARGPVFEDAAPIADSGGHPARGVLGPGAGDVPEAIADGLPAGLAHPAVPGLAAGDRVDDRLGDLGGWNQRDVHGCHLY